MRTGLAPALSCSLMLVWLLVSCLVNRSSYAAVRTETERNFRTSRSYKTQGVPNLCRNRADRVTKRLVDGLASAVMVLNSVGPLRFGGTRVRDGFPVVPRMGAFRRPPAVMAATRSSPSSPTSSAMPPRNARWSPARCPSSNTSTSRPRLTRGCRRVRAAHVEVHGISIPPHHGGISLQQAGHQQRDADAASVGASPTGPGQWSRFNPGVPAARSPPRLRRRTDATWSLSTAPPSTTPAWTLRSPAFRSPRRRLCTLGSTNSAASSTCIADTCSTSAPTPTADIVLRLRRAPRDRRATDVILPRAGARPSRAPRARRRRPPRGAAARPGSTSSAGCSCTDRRAPARHTRRGISSGQMTDYTRFVLTGRALRAIGLRGRAGAGAPTRGAGSGGR